MYGKKRLLLFILLVSFVMIGCANVDQQTELIKDDDSSAEAFSEDISDNQINEIKADCLNYLIASGVNDATIEDIVILEIYGSFNDAVVFRIKRGAYTAFTSVIIGDCELVFSDTNLPIVWYQGKIYELKEAYNAKVLTDYAIKSIQTIINERRLS